MANKMGVGDAIGAKAHLAAALPYIEAELVAMQGALIQKAASIYQAQQMTDATAKELWIELFVIMGLNRRLSTSVKLDAAKSEKLLNQKAT